MEGKPPKYFCSKQEFEAEEERKRKVSEDKYRVYRLICDIMEAPDIINSALFKEWVEWNKVADNVKIARYLEENKDYLTTALGRVTSSEYARIRYLSAIVKNSIKDFKVQDKVQKDVKVQPKVVTDETVYEAPTRSLNKRRSLADLEDELW